MFRKYSFVTSGQSKLAFARKSLNGCTIIIFDCDARRSGPTKYFVGFQRFTQIFTRNTRKLDVSQKIIKGSFLKP